ncbi:MAG: hypothetical protein ACYC61_06330 [Isosphaeraceae bacterium]
MPGRDPNAAQTIAFSLQGDALVSSSRGLLQVWDASTGRFLEGPSGPIENFIGIGHSLLALVLALFGGHLSRYMYGRGQRLGSAADR